mmetsp:Transcript_43138/g.50466  ORF Transcript_43138/g.50466 Transcript_43138/m.50466 type:complete len:204 (-) Transcript_43138:2019-2630(-)
MAGVHFERSLQLVSNPGRAKDRTRFHQRWVFGDRCHCGSPHPQSCVCILHRGQRGFGNQPGTQTVVIGHDESNGIVIHLAGFEYEQANANTRGSQTGSYVHVHEREILETIEFQCEPIAEHHPNLQFAHRDGGIPRFSGGTVWLGGGGSDRCDRNGQVFGIGSGRRREVVGDEIPGGKLRRVSRFDRCQTGKVGCECQCGFDG